MDVDEHWKIKHFLWKELRRSNWRSTSKSFYLHWTCFHVHLIYIGLKWIGNLQGLPSNGKCSFNTGFNRRTIIPSRAEPGLLTTTVIALLTDTFVSEQLYLRPSSLNPVFLSSHTNSVFLHSRESGQFQLRTCFSRSEGVGCESFHCRLNLWLAALEKEIVL